MIYATISSQEGVLSAEMNSLPIIYRSAGPVIIISILQELISVGTAGDLPRVHLQSVCGAEVSRQTW